MKKDKLTIIIYTLIGIIIGLVVALILVLTFKKDNDNIDSNDSTQQVVIETDEEILNEFNEINDTKDENKLKKGFTTIVDFIFYDKEIKGKTFNELKDDTKLKIMNIFISIDSKIDQYFPDYKQTLSSKYNNIKDKITEIYVKTVNKICDSNQNLCENAKNDFNTMKDAFGVTFDYLKEKGLEGLDKIKDWYEEFRDE